MSEPFPKVTCIDYDGIKLIVLLDTGTTQSQAQHLCNLLNKASYVHNCTVMTRRNKGRFILQVGIKDESSTQSALAKISKWLSPTHRAAKIYLARMSEQTEVGFVNTMVGIKLVQNPSTSFLERTSAAFLTEIQKINPSSSIRLPGANFFIVETNFSTENGSEQIRIITSTCEKIGLFVRDGGKVNIVYADPATNVYEYMLGVNRM